MTNLKYHQTNPFYASPISLSVVGDCQYPIFLECVRDLLFLGLLPFHTIICTNIFLFTHMFFQKKNAQLISSPNLQTMHHYHNTLSL